MIPIKFQDEEKRIRNAIQARSTKLGINEPVSLLPGFVNIPLLSEVTASLVVGGPVVPMVALVGEDSGRVYFLALKLLLPERF